MPQFTPLQKKILIILISLTLIIGMFGVAIVLINPRNLPSSLTLNQLIPGTPIPTPKGRDAISVLFIGHGGAGHDGGALSDSMIIANVNLSKKQVSLISIPRDLWARIPASPGIYEYHKLNHAFSIGGGNLAKEVVGNITNIPIDYFISVDFSGLIRAIDQIQGVEVDVPSSFDDQFYPIKGEENNSCGFSPEKIVQLHAQYTGFNLERQFTCRYEQLHFEKGKTTLDGATSLKFVRSRHADGDFARSQRQHALLVGVQNKIISLNGLRDAPGFFRQFVNLIRTDIDEGIITATLKLIGDSSGYTTKSIQLTTENVLKETYSTDRQYILVPKAGDFQYEPLQKFLKQELEK